MASRFDTTNFINPSSTTLLTLVLVKSELQHPSHFDFIEALPLKKLGELLDRHLAYIHPCITTSVGRDPFVLLAMERGLPPVLTPSGATGLCDV